MNDFLKLGKAGTEKIADQLGAAAKVFESTDPTTQRQNLEAAAKQSAKVVVAIGFEFNDIVPDVAAEMADFYVRSYKAMYPGIQGCGLHDPLAVAVAEDPSLARTERMLVDVELNGALTRGQTVADRRRTAEHHCNAQVCMSVDRARFEIDFLAAIKGLKRVQ